MVYAVEAMASEAVLVRAVPELAEITGPMRNLAPHGHGAISDQPVTIRTIPHLRPLLGQLAGYAQVGVRAAGLTNSLDATHEALSAAAGKRLTYVVNLTCRALQRQAGALQGGHDDYYRVADAGCFQLFAKNAQETADLTLIAHRIAELSLTPGICAQDYYRATHSVQTVLLPERALVAKYLGRSEDMIPSPTPAQSFLFGQLRRRIPLLLDRDRPAGIGGVQDQESYFRAVAAQRPFFTSHLNELTDQAMSEYAKLTGRVYHKLYGYQVEDADVVVIAQGAIVEELEAVVDYLRTREKIKAGVIGLRMFRPFPGADLSRMLKKKKTVTVLERTDQPLAEDLPMSQEVRSAIFKAVENGASANAEPPYPSYERYVRASERPDVFCGIYGVGDGLPSFGDLVAVFRNMLPDGSNKKCFYVGALFDPPGRRFPHLQSLQQRLNRDYSGLTDLTVSADPKFAAPEQPGYAIQLHSLSVQGGIFAGNLFAQTLANALNWTVKTYPEGGLEPSIQPVSFTILHAKDDEPLKSKPDTLDMLLVSGDRLIEDLPSRTRVKHGATIIVESNRNPRDLWFSLSSRAARWIEDQGLHIYLIDSRKIASETASRPSFVDQLAIWALFGAYLKVGEHVSDTDLEKFMEHFNERLGQIFGPAHYLIEDITKCVTGGTEGPVEIDWEPLAKEVRGVATEPEPPWTVQQVSQHDRTVFDVNRFWHSVGYLYSTGEAEETLTDPYLATGIMPAGSSAFRDMAPYRLRIPEWLPANCTACGLCWAMCPDSALPPSVNSLSSVLKSAMSQCESNGTTMVQMQRASDNLAKLAYNIVQKDESAQYTTLGPILQDAFSRLVEKMGLDGDKLQPLKQEFDEIHRLVEHHPVSKTDAFFNGPHKRAKGSGTLLSIAHNPLSCTGCGLCVEVCPEDAFDWVDQSPELLAKKHRAWGLQMKLPGISSDEIEQFISSADPQTSIYRMLDNVAYHSMVGGDAAFPGNAAKIAVHLVTSTIESVMLPRFKTHAEKLDRLIGQLEEKIQGKVSRALQINDFESFGLRLGRVRREGLTAEALARVIDEEGTVDVDKDQLARLTGFLSQLKEQRRLYLEGASGAGRARMVVTMDPGGVTFWSGSYPYNPHQHPWISHLPGDGPALAEGVFEGITRTLIEEFKLCRQAELEVADLYDPLEHDEFFEKFDQHDLKDEEWDLVPTVLVISQSGMTSTREIGRLLNSRYPIRIVIINTQGITVADDGTNGATPELDRLTSIQAGDSLGYLLLSQRDVFVLATSVGHPGHLIEGVSEGLRERRPALFHVYAPDPQTNGIAPEKVGEQARTAFESRGFPLFKLNPKITESILTLKDNPEPHENWASHKFKTIEPSGLEGSFTAPLTVAHWAFREARFQRHFRVVPRGHLNDRMKVLPDYLELDRAERREYEPYIDITDDDHRHFLAIVSRSMADAVEERLEFWNYLQELSAALNPEPRPEAKHPTEPVLKEPLPPRLGQSMRKRITETLLELSGYSRDPEFFKQTLGQFITKSSEATTIKETGDD
ncbi:MAG: 4Fe-4S binding protein [Candidatus Latescibacterota bacterium]|nr:MAG: 4Fe-4S binding protein [Candidatus Latescibacterota bacterium]